LEGLGVKRRGLVVFEEKYGLMSLEKLLLLQKNNPLFNELLAEIRKGERPKVVTSSLLRPYLIAALAYFLRRPILVLTLEHERAERLASDIAAFLPKVYYLPEPETLPFDRLSPSPQTTAQRLAVLHALLVASSNVVTTTIQNALRFLPPTTHSVFKPVVLKHNTQIDFEELIRRFGEMGFRRVELVEARAEFAVRGGIVDIFPGNYTNPLRIEFFGDRIESLRTFDISSQRSLRILSSATLFNCREIQLSKKISEKVIQELSSLNFINKPLWLEEEMSLLKEGAYFEGIEKYLPFMFDKLSTVIDFLPSNGLLILEEAAEIKSAAEDFYQRQREIFEQAVSSGNTLPVPDSYFTLPSHLLRRSSLELEVLDKGGRKKKFYFPVETPKPILGHFDRLKKVLKDLRASGHAICLCLRDKGQLKRFEEVLTEWGFNEFIVGKLQRSKIFLTVAGLRQGFILPDARLAVLTAEDILGKTPSRRRDRVSGRYERVSDILDLKKGEYVVHVAHGIGIYQGLIRKAVEGVFRDYVLIEYAHGDKLYVPTDQLDRITRYIGSGGEAPTISRLGGTEWRRTKKRAQASAKRMAFDLLRLYAERARAKGFAFSPDTPWQRELEDAFPYQETSDQLQAILDVKKDMESSRPMDRLICGDVGYGKTEVAIRAAFKAVMDGKQVMVLVPTTILCQQHLATFKDRLAPFPIIVEMLSRFRTLKEQHEIIKNFKEGRIDILIGTHRILQPDVIPKDLGLVVVDEEHRFGVAAKEKLRQLKRAVDVLTLTATPIPRTLQMSLSGIRDMSLIETPPEDRYPVATYVGPEDPELIREAIRRELGRGGQVYFIHNRVETIEEAVTKVKNLVPEARVAVAHGQMGEKELERTMLAFLEHQYDVLVCTSIIESGIDIPNVNTLVVESSEMFGLAQLYQLRGRVGRADRRAYAYFFYTTTSGLKGQAFERLKTVSELSELGSGLRLALRDLEIRGAGNLLGPEQHGHIAAVGFELYCQLLRQAIAELEGKAPVELPEVEIDLPVQAYLPKEYIPSEALRIEAYRKIASISQESEIQEVEQELVDRYGALPREAQALLDIAKIKVSAQRLGVSKVSYRFGKLRLLPLKLPEKIIRGLRRQQLDVLQRGKLVLISPIETPKLVVFVLSLFSDIMNELDSKRENVLEREVAK
jgi:transcription-repair coupling factor (superfamily II helicase)